MSPPGRGPTARAPDELTTATRTGPHLSGSSSLARRRRCTTRPPRGPCWTRPPRSTRSKFRVTGRRHALLPPSARPPETAPMTHRIAHPIWIGKPGEDGHSGFSRFKAPSGRCCVGGSLDLPKSINACEASAFHEVGHHPPVVSSARHSALWIFATNAGAARVHRRTRAAPTGGVSTTSRRSLEGPHLQSRGALDRARQSTGRGRIRRATRTNEPRSHGSRRRPRSAATASHGAGLLA
jgi:hypothetical protein